MLNSPHPARHFDSISSTMKAHGACFSPAALAAFVCLAFSAFAADNELTPAEKADGWRLLFDGKTFAGWLDFRSPGSPIAGWEIMDGTLGAVASASVPAPRPNVLFIIFDDWGWQNAGVYGSTWVRTPTFDRLAREGVLFRNAFTSNPKCSPCRASILTGRNAWQTEEGNAGYPVRAIRTPEWLYVRNYAPERWPAGNLETDFPNCDDGPTKAWITEHRDKFFDRAFGLRPAEVLYRMGADAADPACLDNLAGDPRYAGTVRELRERMEAMLREEGDPRMFGYGEIFDTYPWYRNRAHAYGTWLRKQLNFPPAAEN